LAWQIFTISLLCCQFIYLRAFPLHEQMLSGEFAGCEALRAEQAADGIRSVGSPSFGAFN